MAKRWADMTAGQRVGLVAVAGLELLLTGLAAVDLARRPAEQVRGPRALWWPLLAVQPFGPVAYLLRGRRTA